MRRLADLALRVTLGAALLAPGVGHAAPAPAVAATPQTADDPLVTVRQAAAKLDFKTVRKVATAALTRPGNTRATMVELYHHLGIAQAVLGDEPAATDSFTRLLAIDPEHQLPPGQPPKVMSPFREAGGYWFDKPNGLSVGLTPPAHVAGGGKLDLTITLDDPLAMAATVELAYRLRGATAWLRVSAPASPPPTLTIPASELPESPTAATLELYATAFDANRSELRSAGTAEAPLTVAIDAKRLDTAVVPPPDQVAALTTPPARGADDRDDGGIFKTWWFWTAVGAVALTAGGTAYYLSSQDEGVDLTVTAR